MYFTNYIRYFFYLALNWNPRLATFIIWHEVQGEKKYGLKTTGIDDLTATMTNAERQHASIYQPVNFYTAEKLLAQLTPQEKNTGFLDVGCGLGRVMAMAAHHGFKHIEGIEFAPHLAYGANQLMEDVKAQFPQASLSVHTADAATYRIPQQVGVVFLFNPFDAVTMAGFLAQIDASLSQHPRPLTILYANPVCKLQWLNMGFTQRFSFKRMHYLEGCILEINGNKPHSASPLSPL
ncbi:MAG: class I SAM-dependent methyltransferase [Bacteroidetes bacterium]|nr:MAG: class I SAM-dependent methyltransferase [Bacteroidota bacterium]